MHPACKGKHSLCPVKLCSQPTGRGGGEGNQVGGRDGRLTCRLGAPSPSCCIVIMQCCEGLSAASRPPPPRCRHCLAQGSCSRTATVMEAVGLESTIVFVINPGPAHLFIDPSFARLRSALKRHHQLGSCKSQPAARLTPAAVASQIAGPITVLGLAGDARSRRCQAYAPAFRTCTSPEGASAKLTAACIDEHDKEPSESPAECLLRIAAPPFPPSRPPRNGPEKYSS